MVAPEQLGDHAAHFLIRYKVFIVAGLAAVFLCCSTYIALKWIDNRNETAARDDIYKFEQPLNKKREDSEKSKKTKSLDFDKEYKNLVEDIQKSIVRHAKTQAALGSALNLAEFLVEQQKPKLAVLALEAALHSSKSQGLLMVLAKFELGNAFAADENYEKAKEEYGSVLALSGAQFMMGEVLLRIGLCAEKLGQIDQAKNYYSRVVTEHSETQAANSAKTYLRLLEIKSLEQKTKGS